MTQAEQGLIGHWRFAEMEAWDADACEVEVRALTVRNLGDGPRRLEITTFAEPVLLPAPAHAAR